MNKKWIYLLLLLTGWVLIIFIVNPLGNFPINDDWAYAKNVYHLAVNGVLKFSDWPAMTLIAQTLWGTLFCKIFGFSFTTLRFSVLALSFAGIVFYYLIALKASRNEKTAFIATAVMIFNPLFFTLSYSFMTDVPFLVFILGTVYFFILYLEKSNIKYLLIATFFGLIATMIRQLGIWIMISMILTYIFTSKVKLKQLILLFLTTGIVFLVMEGFLYYLEARKMLSANYSTTTDLFRLLFTGNYFRNIISRICDLFFYSGFFLSPFVFYVLPSVWQQTRSRVRWIMILITILLSIPLFFFKAGFPSGNVIYNFGLNPKILTDTFWGLHWRPHINDMTMAGIQFVVLIFTAVMILTLLLSITMLFKNKREENNRFEWMMKIQAGIIWSGFFGLLLINQFFFDRYFLPLITFLSLFLLTTKVVARKWSTLAFIILFTVIAWFSISGTQDNLAFNRARWKGLSSLMNAGISPANIDGGFEFNGWYETGKRNQVIRDSVNWWFVKDDYYIVARGPVYGYKSIRAFSYTSYLTFRQDSLVILHRTRPLHNDSTIITCDAEQLSENGSVFITSMPGINAWNVDRRSDKASHSGKYSILLDKEHQYGFTVDIHPVLPCEKFRITVWTKNNNNQAAIVIATPNSKDLYRQSKDIDPENKDWKMMSVEASLFERFPHHEISVYLWNYGGKPVYFDDLKIVWYKDPVQQ